MNFTKYIALIIIVSSCNSETGLFDNLNRSSKRGEKDVVKQLSSDQKNLGVFGLQIEAEESATQSDKVTFKLVTSDAIPAELTQKFEVTWEVSESPVEDAFVQIIQSNKLEPDFYFDDFGSYTVSVSAKFEDQVDNAEHQIRIDEYILPKPNIAPRIRLSDSNYPIVVGEQLAMGGEVSDDAHSEFPNLNIRWEVADGDAANVTFSATDVVDPTVDISSSGEYVFRLVASDGQYEEFKDTGVTAYNKRLDGTENYYVMTTHTESTADSWGCALDESGLHCWGSFFQANLADIVNPQTLVVGSAHACVLDRVTVESEEVDQVKCFNRFGAALTSPETLGSIHELAAGMTSSCVIHTISVERPAESGTFVDVHDVECWGGFTSANFTTQMREDLDAADELSNLVLGDTGEFCVYDATNHKVLCGGGNTRNNIPVLEADETVVKLNLEFRTACGIFEKTDLTRRLACWGSNSNSLLSVPNFAGLPIDVGVGSETGCVISDDQGTKSISCWGQNNRVRSRIPTDFQNPVRVWMGIERACVIEEFSARCWGRDRGNSLSTPGFEFGLITLSPEEQQIRDDFTNVVRAIMQTNCSGGGCHAGVNWHSDLTAARGNAGNIKDRINRDPGANGYMPRPGRDWDDPANKDLLNAWLDLVLGQ